MYIIGDIGNSEVKICIYSKKNKFINKIILKTDLINNKYLNKKFSTILKNKNKITKILFSSVVPKKFQIIKIFLKSRINVKCLELKQVNVKNMIKVIIS